MWVARRYDGPSHKCDQAVALTLDGLGNVYVTGTSEIDFLTIKYKPNGLVQWIARYDGPGNYIDKATALAIDNAGNVYVTGYSYEMPHQYDYATVKYDSNGVQQWVARYNGPGSDLDIATAMAVGSSGNVYVTGFSTRKRTGTGEWVDYATVKYNADGIQEWISRYNGSGNWDDQPQAIAVDDSENVYVTGSSTESSSHYDYATIKYDSTGEVQWESHYDGSNRDNVAVALALDIIGNVYVAGKIEGIDTGLDNCIVKYSPGGDQIWIAQYDGSGNSNDYTVAMALDEASNVYITGGSRVPNYGCNYATVKFNTDGTQEWVARFDDLEILRDEPKAIVVDDAGNVYVTGNSGTLKYNNAGNEKWINSINGHLMSIDVLGNILVAGENESDLGIVKINSDGVQQWSAYYGPNNSYNKISALVIDDNNYFYATGESWGDYSDIVTIKYSPDGLQEWSARFNGSGIIYDRPNAMDVDTMGNVYVTGWTGSLGARSDFITLKYDSEGILQWETRYSGENDWMDIANAIAVDDSGYVYVTGNSDGNYVTIKYDSNGIQQWIASYEGLIDLDYYICNKAVDLTIDDSGNVYVTGSSVSSNSFPYRHDIATVKYSSDGILEWVRRYDMCGCDNYASGIEIDNSGNVFVSGFSKGEMWSICTVIKYGQTPVSVADHGGEIPIPNEHKLWQNSPNPFNAETDIRYQIEDAGLSLRTTLKIYNILSQEVRTLVDATQEPGYYTVTWDGKDSRGLNVASGVYFFRITVGEFTDTKCMLLLK